MDHSSNAASGCPDDLLLECYVTGCDCPKDCNLVAWPGACLDHFSSHPDRKRSAPVTLFTEKPTKREIRFQRALSTVCHGLRPASSCVSDVASGPWPPSSHGKLVVRSQPKCICSKYINSDLTLFSPQWEMSYPKGLLRLVIAFKLIPVVL